MDELLDQFLIEGPELIQQGAEALLALERAPADRAALDRAFRAVHTLKGSVGLFELPAMARTLHRAEDLLGQIRSGGRACDSATVSRLLAVLGQSERWLAALQAHGGLPEGAEAVADRLIAQLAAAASPSAAPEAATEAPAWAAALVEALPSSATAGDRVAIRYRPSADAYFNGDDPVAIVAAVPGLVHLELSLDEAAIGDEPYDPFTCHLLLQAVSTADALAVKEAFRLVSDQVELVPVRQEAALVAPDSRPVDFGGRTLRIDVERVDALAALAAELVAAKAALSNAAAAARHATDARRLAEVIAAHAGAIDRLAGQIHQGVTALRMIPVAPLLRRFPRVVREMADGLGKEVEVVIDDAGVEADKAIIEGLGEPLTHLLRNAVDHGIETRDVRMMMGKPSRGRIVLAARESAGRLVIRLSDDGRGIDPGAIRRLAAERSLMDAARLEALTDAEVVELIFLPGFSTADRVTDLSGRGVGMDAVRAAVQGLGGRIGVTSAPGEGTAVELSLPLAVSLTKIMVVAEAGDRYGLPLERVLETLRVPAAQVIPIRDGYAFNWRNRAVPLAPLSALTRGERRLAEGDQRVVVVKAGAQAFGIAIDRIDDRLDVAMRPLDGLLAGMRGISGAAVLGDGGVLMILDTEALS